MIIHLAHNTIIPAKNYQRVITSTQYGSQKAMIRVANMQFSSICTEEATEGITLTRVNGT